MIKRSFRAGSEIPLFLAAIFPSFVAPVRLISFESDSYRPVTNNGGFPRLRSDLIKTTLDASSSVSFIRSSTV